MCRRSFGGDRARKPASGDPELGVSAKAPPEIGEELVRHLLGRPVNEALS
jgi:hypothetical protein